MLTLIISRFVGFRADIAQCRMATLPIIERFDVKENVGTGLGAGFIKDVMHVFRFQAAKEALGRRIVVAVARPTHADEEAVVL